MIRLVDTGPVRPEPHEAIIEAAIARHGATAVLIAALRALMRVPRLRPPPAAADDLPAHLRRDIGLPPKAAHARLEALPPLPPRF
ncbi:hypothetical protein [Roseivivax sediminis]|uniref:Uncharacterized protein n=1 Tax=Roseivivax sediminis TaxID=936889 RepID=A0A1I1UJ88_9RHOB|nr:hypothetical protein [Roseivivax sediminis]SFD70655.1 hypothetical protein SAMN04515678_102369 [Roseivivax sediminis]